jgi:NADPH:quinone reductase-like Zn-dependent oxidoreductase
LGELYEGGKVIPVIDRRYPLHEVPEALRYLEKEPRLGKIVIMVKHGDET